MNKRLVKNYVYNTLYQVLILISPLITTPYVSRVLGASGIGIYSYAQSIASYFVLFGGLGTNIYGQREIAYVEDEPQKRTEVFWKICVLRIIMVMLCIGCYLFIFSRNGENLIIYKILSIEILATAFDISWFFIGMENFRLIVIRNTVIKIIGIILVFVLVKTSQDVPLYTVCLTLPILFGNISLWFSLPKYLVRVDSSIIYKIPEMLKPILVLFIPQVASQVYLILDKTMIGLFSSGMNQVGYYTQAQKIIKMILMIVTSLGTVMAPAMSFAYAQGKKEEIRNSVEKSFSIVFMIASPLMFGICAVSSKFVPVFYGAGYDEVVPLMIIISPIIIIIGISNVVGRQYLIPTNQQNYYTASIVMGACVNFILNYVLIRRIDAIGASIATVAAEMMVTVVQCWCVRKQLPLWACIKPMFRYLIFGAVMYCVLLSIRAFMPASTFTIILLIAFGAIIYILELIFTKDEILYKVINMVIQKMDKKTKN